MSAENSTAASLPDLNFVATVAVGWAGALNACSHIWDGYPMGCPVLDSTPLKDAEWATLHAYMQRRFGLATRGADDYKDLGAGWTLSTPDPKVFVDVLPSLSGAGFSFTPRCADEALQRWGHAGESLELDTALSSERIESIKTAYRTTLLDLLRPVNVRDRFINALGEVEDGALLDVNKETDELVYLVRFHSSSGYGMPVGLFGGKDWPVLCGLILQLGCGDMEAGRRSAIQRLQQQVLNEIALAPWPVQRLVLLGSPDAVELATRMGFSDAARATFEAERKSLGQEVLPTLVDEMTDSAVNEASAYLSRLGHSGQELSSRVKSLHRRKTCKDCWDDLVALAKDDFPNASVPEAPWELSTELPTVFKSGLREHGREDLADWVDRVMAKPEGMQALRQIVFHLAIQSAEPVNET